MADNVSTADTVTFATDDLAGVHHPYNKIEFGGDGTATPVSADTPLPVVVSGVSTDATLELLGGAIMLLSAILEKMPRVDGNDRLIINGSEIASSVAVSSGSLTSVGTVSTVSTLANQANIGGRDASHMVYAVANAGAMHIYDNIKFS